MWYNASKIDSTHSPGTYCFQAKVRTRQDLCAILEIEVQSNYLCSPHLCLANRPCTLVITFQVHRSISLTGGDIVHLNNNKRKFG